MLAMAKALEAKRGGEPKTKTLVVHVEKVTANGDIAVKVSEVLAQLKPDQIVKNVVVDNYGVETVFTIEYEETGPN